MSKILETVYASVTDDIQYHTLELQNPAFPDGVLRWVQGFDDKTFYLENGLLAEFDAMPFAVSLPSSSVRGDQDLQFQLDNISGEVLQSIRTVLSEKTKISVIYRVYLESQNLPAQTAVKMTATGFSANYYSVNISANFHDFVNREWPSKRYTSDNAPGLKYL